MGQKHIENREIRLFISSTFRDMYDERDYLITKTFPMLRHLASQRDVTLTEVDLRWGITKEESENGKVVEICLDEIDNCVPFFLGIIGNRYGWCPGMEEFQRNPILKEKYGSWLSDDFERKLSVTEIEMQYGVLRRNEDLHASFFIKKGGVSEDTANDREKLDIFKMAVRSNGRYPVFEYDSVEQLSDIVESRFVHLLNEMFPEGELSDFEKTELVQTSYVNHLGDSYVPETESIKALDAFISDDTRTSLTIYGESGVGKSALLANYYRQNIGNDNILWLPFFVSGSMNADHEEILDYWRNKEGRDDPEGRKRKIYLLDGVDVFLASDNWKVNNLGWIPHGEKIIITTMNKDYTLDGSDRVIIADLNESQKRNIITTYLNCHRKALTGRQIEKIVSSKITGNAKILKVTLSCLVSFGVFEQLDALIDYFVFAQTKEEFYQKFLAHIESLYGRELVMNTLASLSVSVYGIFETRMPQIIGKAQLYWSQIYCALIDFFSCVNGAVRFDSGDLQEAVNTRYEDNLSKIRNHLCECYERILPEAGRNEQELIWTELAEMYYEGLEVDKMYSLFMDPDTFMYFVMKRADRIIAYNGQGKQIYRYWEWIIKSSDYDMWGYLTCELPEWNNDKKSLYLWSIADVAEHAHSDAVAIEASLRLYDICFREDVSDKEKKIGASLALIPFFFKNDDMLGLSEYFTEVKGKYEQDKVIAVLDKNVLAATQEYILSYSDISNAGEHLSHFCERLATLTGEYSSDMAFAKYRIASDEYSKEDYANAEIDIEQAYQCHISAFESPDFYTLEGRALILERYGDILMKGGNPSLAEEKYDKASSLLDDIMWESESIVEYRWIREFNGVEQKRAEAFAAMGDYESARSILISCMDQIFNDPAFFEDDKVFEGVIARFANVMDMEGVFSKPVSLDSEAMKDQDFSGYKLYLTILWYVSQYYESILANDKATYVLQELLAYYDFFKAELEPDDEENIRMIQERLGKFTRI